MNKDEQHKMVCLIEDGKDLAAIKQMVLDHPDSINTDFGSGTWLYQAASEGNIGVINLLIDMGADVNQIHRIKGMTGGSSALTMAAIYGQVKTIELLLSKGAIPNDEENRVMLTAVGSAPKDKSLEIVKLLHKHGSDIHHVYIHKATGQSMNALSEAEHRPDVVKYLIEQGCKLPQDTSK